MGKTTSNIATIRASVFAQLIRALDESGRKADRLFAEHGLSRTLLEDPYAVIPLARYVAIFESAAQLIQQPALGLHLGSSARPADLGPLGLLFSAAPTLRSAFARLSEFISALQSATRVGLHQHEDLTSWTYQIEDPSIWPRIQDTEFSMVAACRLARTSAGASWSPVEVHFEHDEPDYRQLLDRFFRTPLRFKQPTNRLLLANADIDRLVQREDHDLTSVLEHHIRDLLAERMGEADTARQVERLISLNLGQASVQLERLAADLGLSARTLQRRLKEEGTSLRLLLRNYRQTAAELRVRSTKASQANIAHALGYSDGTVFWRAFKNWTGATPTELRKHAKKK